MDDRGARWCGEGVTILLTTQYLEEADRLADRIGVLDRGRIVAEGAAEELKADDRGRAGASAARRPGVVRAAVALLPAAVGGPGAADARRSTPTAAREPWPSCSPRASAAGSACAGVDTLRPSLDDVFLSLTDRRTVAA